jgi:diguanylate cyclase (GGDEF)-like protein
MALNNKQIQILDDLLARYRLNIEGVDDVRFQLDHEEEVGEIDNLFTLRLIDRNNRGKLIAPFTAVLALRGKSSTADEIIMASASLFQEIKAQFRLDPDRNLLVSELAQKVSQSVEYIRIALLYLIQVPIWSNQSADLNASQAFVRASTGILRYKTFAEVITQLERWNLPPAPLSAPKPREKQQKFRILDSPALLELDLAFNPGILGRVLLYIDLDDFKALNTRLSEVVVDREILPVVQKTLSQCSEQIGFCYAEGGDEFVILLPNSSVDMGKEYGLAIAKCIQDLVFGAEASTARVTATIGLAHESVAGDGQTLKEYANRAMRQAKLQGKNQLRVWNGEDG